MNPITQRSTTPGQQNGVVSQSKPAPKASLQDSTSGEKPCNERLMFLFANAMVSFHEPQAVSFLSKYTSQGQTSTITTKSGDIFSGIFFGASMDKSEPEYLLKMVQQVRAGHKGDANGVRETSRDFIGFGEDHAMSFKMKEVVDFAVEGIPINNQDRRPNGWSLADHILNGVLIR